MYKARYYAGRQGLKMQCIDFIMYKSNLFNYGNGTCVGISINDEAIGIDDTRYFSGITTKQGFEKYCESWLKNWFGEAVIINHSFTKQEEVKA